MNMFSFFLFIGEDEELVDPEVDSASKRRRSSKSTKVKKSTGNKCGHHYNLIVCTLLSCAMIRSLIH